MKKLHWYNIAYLSMVHAGGLYGCHILITKWRDGTAQFNLLALFIFFFYFSSFGITAGAHRLWAHRTYSAHPLFEILLMLMNSCANQGSIFHWVRDHRAHHAHVDSHKDPVTSRCSYCSYYILICFEYSCVSRWTYLCMLNMSVCFYACFDVCLPVCM